MTFAPPPLSLLAFENVATDLPVQCHQLAIHTCGGACTGKLDPLLELCEPAAIVFVTLRGKGIYHPAFRLQCRSQKDSRQLSRLQPE